MHPLSTLFFSFVTRILGISAFYHDSAAALVKDGIIIAAAQEERFNRKKHYAGFPYSAISYCLEKDNISLKDIDYVVFYEKPFLTFERLLETYLSFAPRGLISFVKSMPLWIKHKLFQKEIIRKSLVSISENKQIPEILFSEHHLSHASSAFYPSPFSKALILTLDGVGEWATTSVALGNESKIEIKKEIFFPHSIGLLYSSFTYFLGLKVNSGEYKLMGLAPYGEPKYADIILEHLIDLKEDGSYRLNMGYFDYCTGLKMTNKKFEKLFGIPPRKPEELLTEKHMDIAASIQLVTEKVLLTMTDVLAKEFPEYKNLCLAGGVALNCVANGKILKQGNFNNIWIQPASGDAGGAVGSALAAYHLALGKQRQVQENDGMQGGYLGQEYSQVEIESELDATGAKFTVMEEAELLQKTTEALIQGKAVGWFQGRAEFGPRALGNRSILGDPTNKTMQKDLNLKVKFRESFRPFAPAVLEEDVSEWFDMDVASPYMLLVCEVAKKRQVTMKEEDKKLFGIDKLNVARSAIPSVTHVDYSARVQTVSKTTNPKFHALISVFKEKTGCGVLVNTSFNVRGEPIVNSPGDAFRCFMGTGIETLVIGNCFLEKEKQEISLIEDYKHKFELD